VETYRKVFKDREIGLESQRLVQLLEEKISYPPITPNYSPLGPYSPQSTLKTIRTDIVVLTPTTLIA
jgi:hypothetical protein